MIAQHPREEFHPLGTARIVERCLNKSVRVTEQTERLEEALLRHGVDDQTAVLYPSEDAELLSEIPPAAHPNQVLVLDGTWHHAKTLVRDVPLIRRLRRVRFVRNHPSEYQIRKEPKQEYLSTVESVHHTLSSLEPETAGLDGLLKAFRAMIRMNMEARRPEGRTVRFQNRSRHRAHRFPQSLRQVPERFVAVYCEGTSRFATQEHPGAKRQPLYLAMERPFVSGAAYLQMGLQTRFPPPERLVEHLALNEHPLRASPEQARLRIQQFLGEDDVVCAWNNSSVRILEELGVLVPQTLPLKATYCDFVRYLHFRDHSHALPLHTGDLDDVLVREEIRLGEVHGAGRGLKRLAQTTAMLRWIYRAYQEHGAFED